MNLTLSVGPDVQEQALARLVKQYPIAAPLASLGLSKTLELDPKVTGLANPIALVVAPQTTPGLHLAFQAAPAELGDVLTVLKHVGVKSLANTDALRLIGDGGIEVDEETPIGKLTVRLEAKSTGPG